MSESSILHIIVPVYNEGENFRSLYFSLNSTIQTPFKLLVIYDFDEDNTVPVVREVMRDDSRIALVKNSEGRGVIGALRTGFKQVQAGPLMVVMGDLSDDLAIADKMVRLYEQGFAVVAASRYMPGGQMIGGPLVKRILSRWAGRSLYFLRRLPTSDATNAFKLYDGAMLSRLNLESSGGFELSLEITVKAFIAGYRITELPTVWRDRSKGESRFRLWHWLPKYLYWYLYAFRRRAANSAASYERLVA